MIPRATYRMQFHKGFAFADAIPLASYLAKLGISHLYASPILTARAGSTHGYDVIDHAHISSDLGGEEGFRALAAALKEQGLGIILDIVPNHMAVGGADNPCWLDLLEKGRDSVFANMFDIDWEPAQPSLRDKVLVPLLGDKTRDAIDAGDLRLIWDERLGKYAFAYADHRFPLRKEDYDEVADLAAANTTARLRALLERQNFRLAFWRDAAERINWRRFFDINELAALRIEDDGVFEIVHATVFRLYAEGLIDGVRVDHVDGLADPSAYCRKLRARLEALAMQRDDKSPAYIVVEKILAADESLPLDWEVDGTTGYDFMDQVSALQHAAPSADRFATLWSDLSGRAPDFASEEKVARHEILESAFASQLRATAAAFHEAAPDICQTDFSRALTVLLERFHAYRTYPHTPSAYFDAAYSEAKAVAPGPALDVIAGAIRGTIDASDAARRFNQLAAPVAAKAVEDTAFYRYGRLLSRNDVGFTPSSFGITPQHFLEKMRARPPHAMLATATHDHKRGADVRARLAALSEIPDIWEEEVRAWFDLNAPFRTDMIGRGDEYQLYQTLVGGWPLDVERVLAWREKSLREAKLQTSWAAPNADVEKAHADFIRAILAASHAFRPRLGAFVARLAPAGVLNGLVQTVLHYTAPGVPDLYQGTELWDLSLVDPDNRRPVDYAQRGQMLNTGTSLHDWQNGGAKLALIQCLLTLRKTTPEAFTAEAEPVAAPAGVFAFQRGPLLVAVPLHCARHCIETSKPLPPVRGVIAAAGAWRNGLDPAFPAVPSLECAQLFAHFPAAVLIR
ncbi:MAG: malto-oligosyltrehalose synthase [Alphaproteobacteria bacterium]|nr:malto-oligosyltrehalose synthase [Alphaproteobacteria bacterium]MBV9541321.1 malto-oligosyltrehalose synthase [Alphaproteobacteria bacterium]